MSVKTTADEKLTAAKENISEAIKNLSSIVVDKVWGADEFNVAYDKAIKSAFYKLIAIRDILD